MYRFAALSFAFALLAQANPIITVTTPGSSEPWYDENYSKRISVTINSSQVSSTLTDYPLYVDLSQMPASFHSSVQTDGDDIRASKDDHSTGLQVELVWINTGSNSGEFYVKVPSVSSSSDTVIYLYYSSPSATAFSTPENVWSNYMGVWHMHAAGDVAQPSATGESAIDADPNNLESGDSVAGIAGNSIDYDGSNEYHSIPQTDATSKLSPDLTHSVSLWCYPDDTTDGTMFANRVNSTAQGIGLWIYGGNVKGSMGGYHNYWDKLSIAIVDPDPNPGPNRLTTGAWNYLHLTFVGGATGWLRLANAANGMLQDVYLGSTTGHNFASQPCYFGRRPSGDYYHGRIDEIRITDANTTNAYHTAEYDNYMNFSTFTTIGTEETQ